MINFSCENHPIIRILSLSKNIHNSIENNSPFVIFSKKINEYKKHSRNDKDTFSDPLKVIADISLLLQSIKFRPFSEDELHKIFEMLISGSTMIEIDNIYEFAFPFFSDSIKDITFQSIKSLLLFFQKAKKSNTQSVTQKSKNLSENFYIDLNNENTVESLSIFIFFIFYSTVSWMANSERTKTSEGISVLLDKLNLIMSLFIKFSNLNTCTNLNNNNEDEEKFFIDFTQVKKLAIDTFLFILYYTVEHFPDFTFTDEIFGSLNEFFSKIIFKNANKPKITHKTRANSAPSTYKNAKKKKNADDDEYDNVTFLNSIHILIYFLSIELNKNSEKVPSLCNFISQVIENQTSSEFFTEKLYQHIFDILAGNLSEMNETILQFFVRLSANFDLKDEKILSLFPNFLRNFLDNHTKNPIKIVHNSEQINDDQNLILIGENEEVPIIDYRSDLQNFQFNFLNETTFENGLTLVQGSEAPPSLRQYLPNEVVSRIDLVSELFLGTPFTEQFNRILNEIDKENNLDNFLYYLAVFLSICEDQHEIAPHFIMTIFNSPLFSGKYKDVKKCKFISSAIYSSVCLLVQSDLIKLLMEPIINTKLYLPTVLTEIFQDLNILINYRLQLNSGTQKEEAENDDESIYSYFTSQPFIMIFYNVSLFYQTANINDRQNIDAIEKCRVSLLLFMESFIIQWSRSHFFNTMFMSYLFEPSLQPFVLSHMKSLILSGHCDADIFTSIFESCKLILEKDDRDDRERNRTISLMFRILKIVNSAISPLDSSNLMNRKPFVTSLHKPLTNILLKLKKDEIEFICEIIEYFSITSDQNSIDPLTIQTFSEAIQKIGVTNEIRSKLIRLLAGNQAPSIVSHFEIEQPHALPLFVTLFIGETNSDQLNNNLKLLEQLVTFSTKNAIMCHKGGLDYVLLDLIDNCLKAFSIKERSQTNLNEDIEFDFDQSNSEDDSTMSIALFRKDLMMKSSDELRKEVKSAMSLFTKITTVASSIPVVRKYVSLMSASVRIKALLMQKGENESEVMYRKMSDFYFTNLIDLISSKFRMPTTYLPLTARRTPTVEVNSIPASYFSEGFTSTFWVYLVQQSVKKSTVLFILKDSDCNEITAKIIDTSFIIMFYSGTKMTTFTLDATFPTEQWFLTTVTVINNKSSNVYTVTASINSNPIYCDCLAGYFELQDSVTITINGNTNDSTCLSTTKTAASANSKAPVRRSLSSMNYDKQKEKDDFLNDNLMSKRAMSVNFVKDDYQDPDDGALLGPFGFFQPLSHSSIIQMHQSGPRSIPKSTYKDSSDDKKVTQNANPTTATSLTNQPVVKIIYVYFDKLNGVFNAVKDTDCLSTKSSINLRGPKYHQSFSFDEILVQFFKIQSLIPLFKFDEEKADEIVSLFSMVLSLGTYVQTNFHLCHGFSTISHILKHYDGKHLTYSLYSKFVNLNNTLTVQELKTDLIENIIVRFDLWCRSSSIETKQRIIKHWLQVNSEYDTNFNGNYRTFDDIIFSLDYFDAIPLKQSLLKLLFKVEKDDQISLENTNKFIKFIIYQAKVLKRDVSYLLEFLLINCQFFASSNLFVNLATLLSCLSFYYTDNPNEIKHGNNIIFIIIELFNKLYKYKKIQKPRSFYHLVDSMIDIIPIDLFKEEKNILKLIEYSKTIPECLSLLFYGICFCNDYYLSNIQLVTPSISSSIYSSYGDSSNSDQLIKLNGIKSDNQLELNRNESDDVFRQKINLIVENLKANGNYCFSKNWFLWPLIAAFRINDNFFTNFIMNFIVNSVVESQNNQQQNEPQQTTTTASSSSSSSEQNQNQQKISSRFHWADVVVTIILVGDAFLTFILNKNSTKMLNRIKDVDTFNFIKSFLNVLFLKEKKGDELNEFLNLCQFYIFFKPIWYQNKALQTLIYESPFRRSSSSSSSASCSASISPSPSASSNASSALKTNASKPNSRPINKLHGCNKSDIFNQLKENFKKEKKYRFSLRFDEEGNWIDRDFAIQLYEESSQFSEFQKINRLIKFLINKQSSFDSNSDSNQMNFNSKEMIKYYNAFIYVNTRMQPFITAMNTLHLKISKSVIKETPISTNDNSVEFTKIIKSIFNRKMENINNFASCCWQQLWISMNAESMPWQMNLKAKPKTTKSEEEEDNDENYSEKEEFIDHLNNPIYPIHWKLDFTPCFAFCPMKLRKEFHYFKHKSLREVQVHELKKRYRNKLKNDSEIKKEELMKKIIDEERQSNNKKKEKTQGPPLSILTPTIDSQTANINSNPNSIDLNELVNDESMKELPIDKIRCEMITIKHRMKGRMFFYQDRIELRLKKKKSKKENNEKDVKKIIDIYYDEIRMILSRMILHRPTGIEIFTFLRNSFLLNFNKTHFSQVIAKFNAICPNRNICILTFPSQMNSLNSFSTVSFQFPIAQTTSQSSSSSTMTDHTSAQLPSIYSSMETYLSALTNWWKSGYVSNFNYLIELNLLSGRSFNDPSMYPVFPWIVNDYDCKKIRWRDRDFYRDLSLPVGALNKERLNELCQRREEMIHFNSDFIFLYGAGYSTPLSLFNWMIRLEPFASLHVEMQNGHFDHPHRLFYSIKNAFKMSTSNANDYRELIPEFYFLPGFLENKNKFNFGCLEDDHLAYEAMIKKYDMANKQKDDSSGQKHEGSKDNDKNHSDENDNEKEYQNDTTDDDKQRSTTDDDKQRSTTDDEKHRSTTDGGKNSDDDEDEEVGIKKSKRETSSIHNDNEEFEESSKTSSTKKKPRPIDDVALPSWASSPLDFIYKHRKILESRHVSHHLNEWIDLIFGVEQKNPEINQFHPWMYSNVWAKRQQQKSRRSSNISSSNSHGHIQKVIISSSSLMFSSSSSLSASNSSLPVIDAQRDSENENENTDNAEMNENETDSGAGDEYGIPSVSEIEGFLMQCGQIPQQLFVEKHPTKQKLKRQLFLKENLVVKINTGDDLDDNSNDPAYFFYSTFLAPPVSSFPKDKSEVTIDFACFIKKERSAIDSKERLIFAYITDDGLLVKAVVSTSGVDCELVCEDKIDLDQLSQKKFRYFNGYLAASTETGKVQIFNIKGGELVKELKDHIGSLNCLASDHILFVSSGSDSSTNIYDQKLDLLFSIPSFRGRIISSYVNSIFSIVASITQDSSLFLISTSTGTITKVISLHNRQPLSVIVTNAWGFIVVFAEENIFNKSCEKWQICHFFMLYSINGEKICERKVDFIFSISAWVTFTSCDGFDYLGVCDDKGNLYAFEVYPFITSSEIQNDHNNKEKFDINDDFIDFNESSDSSSPLTPIFKSNTTVKTLFYWNDWRTIVGIGRDGSAFFVPLEYHQL